MINWGILGTGAIAKAFADALQDTEGNLIAVASNSLSRAEEFSSSYGCNSLGSPGCWFENGLSVL